MKFQNLPSIISLHSQAQPEAFALFYRPHANTEKVGPYHGITYRSLQERIVNISLGLQALGARSGDRIGILSHNRPEWLIADMAIMSLGAITVPIYPTLSTKEVTYIIANSGIKYIIVESLTNVNDITAIKDRCESLETIIAMDTFSELEKLGEEVATDKRALWQKNVSQLSRETIASIVYTSGTTANPKGVVLTHGNMLSNVEDLMEVIPLSAKDRALSFLPLSHTFERTVGHFTILGAGGGIYYAQSIGTVSEDMILAQPTIVVSVPRLYEKIRAKILEGLRHFFQKQIFNWALNVGDEMSALRKNHRKISKYLKVRYEIAEKLVFKKVQKKMGGKLRFFVSGGAPLAAPIGQFFESMGFIIIEGYGLTEAAPVIACNRLGKYKFGTVGIVLPSQKVKVAPDGELLVKGENIMSEYYGLEKETTAVFDRQGWFRTGDIAEISSKGFIKIIDRKKELIVLSNGKKVAPKVIEMQLLQNSLISQVLVVGEKRNFLTALICPNWDLYKIKTQKSVQNLREATIFYQKIIDSQLKEFANFEKIKKILILNEEFTEKNGQLTPTLKPKRRVIEKVYAKEIEELYFEQRS